MFLLKFQTTLICLCPSRAEADFIGANYKRFSKYLFPTPLKISVLRGGSIVELGKDFLRKETPHIVVGSSCKVLAILKDQQKRTQMLNDVKQLAVYSFHKMHILPGELWSVQSSGDFIDRRRAMLVFYARVKSRAAFAEAFVRG